MLLQLVLLSLLFCYSCSYRFHFVLLISTTVFVDSSAGDVANTVASAASVSVSLT